VKPIAAIVRFLISLKGKYITNTGQLPGISETREKKPSEAVIPDCRQAGQNPQNPPLIPAQNLSSNLKKETIASVSTLEQCPYCKGKDVVKRGLRQKKYEKAQLYFCNRCQKTFTGQKVKGKSFPLATIFEGLSLYNLGYSLEQSCRLLREQFGLEVKPSTLNDWVKEFSALCRYSRFRPYGLKLFSPSQVIRTAHLFHHQVYDFSAHRAKLALLLQEYMNNKFDNLREFLEAIQTECPHQFFKDGERASELKVGFSPQEVIIREKQNFATRLAGLALQAVSDNKLRHKALQRFMLCNDSVTVAVEVPVYMDQMDIEHMQDELKFKIPIKLDKVLTGHIDILQLRNGAVHILDYKPQGTKGKEGSKAFVQLTLYALMLSRLTGLRLFDFKCAWFDENAYYEFFPLHVVYKLRQQAKKESPDQLKLSFQEQEDKKDVSL
jgi:transposase-like protein